MSSNLHQKHSRGSKTGKQQEAWELRYERGISIAQIADWLKISRRAVLYRLRNARKRMGDKHPAD